MTIDVKEWHPIVPRNLYLINNGNYEMVVHEDTVKFYRESDYYKNKLKVISELGPQCPEGLQIRLISTGSGRCYSSATYELSSPKVLTDAELELVRSQYDFESVGQSHAKSYGYREENGVFIYRLFCEIDSGD